MVTSTAHAFRHARNSVRYQVSGKFRRWLIVAIVERAEGKSMCLMPLLEDIQLCIEPTWTYCKGKTDCRVILVSLDSFQESMPNARLMIGCDVSSPHAWWQ